VKFVDYDFVAGADGTKILSPKPNIVPKFLFYILKSLDLPDLGYSRHFKELKLKEIPLPPIEVQQKIVDELEGYQKIIDGCRQVVENYKPTIDIDPSWELKELKTLCSINASSGEPKDLFDETFIYLDISSVESLTGKIDFSNKLTTRDYPSRARRIIQRNDILMSSVRPNLKSFAYVDFEVKNHIASTGFMVLSSNEELLNSRFLYFLLFTDFLQSQMVAKMGKGQYPSINATDTSQLLIPVPSIKVQNHIAKFMQKEQVIVDGNRELIQIFTQKIQDRISKVWGE
jgi:type I restriction enzyme M protein